MQSRNQNGLDLLGSDDDDDRADDVQLEHLLAQAKASLPPTSNPTSRRSRSRLPQVGSSTLPKPYFTPQSGKKDAPPTLARNLDVEELAESTSLVGPAAPSGPQTAANGRLLTKRQLKEMKNSTAGPDWFDLPAPRPHELPELYKQVEALRLRRAMDPKVHAKADPGEKKGIKGLPKFFAIGKVIDTPTPFKTRSTANLSRKERHATLVDELVADPHARQFAKRKFDEIAALRRGRMKYQEKAFKKARKW